MKRASIVLLGLLTMGMFANTALAQAPVRNGYIEVCKAANPALIDGFRFNIVDAIGTQTVTIGIGTCTQPIPVVSGVVTVTELGALTGLTDAGTISTTPTTEFLSATSTAVGPTGPLGTVVGFVRTVNVPVSPNGSSSVITVTYNNTLVTGVVEVCKQFVAGSGLTGSWQFTITGGNGFSSVQTVPNGNCSPPVTVPAGRVKVQETGDASQAVTAITATRTAALTNVVLGPLAGPAPDLDTATVVAAVVPGDASTQTLVTFTNNSVRLKLCKYVDQGLTNVGPYTFTFPSVMGNAGPIGPIAPESITAGIGAANAVCKVIGTFRAGTTVQIVEGIVPGTKVGSITVNPSINAYNGGPTIVPGSLSLPNRTVTVVLGKGETVVTYQDVPALPGILKICKVAGVSTPAVPPGTVFTFDVTLASGAVVVVAVPAGSCAVVGTTHAFNTTVSIVERALPNMKVQSITAVPTFVVVGGVNTNQPVLTNTNIAARSTSVTIGENNITEVTYVNIDPIDPPPGNTGGGGGGSASTGGGGAASESASPTILPTTPAIVPTSIGIGFGVGTSSGTGNTTAATNAAVLKAAKLSKLEKQMTTLKAKLKRLVAKSAAAKTPAAKRSLARQITALKVSKATLAKQIRLLK